MKSLSRVRLLATPWSAAHQAPPSMGFSRQEYWSGVPKINHYYYMVLANPSFINQLVMGSMEYSVPESIFCMNIQDGKTRHSKTYIFMSLLLYGLSFNVGVCRRPQFNPWVGKILWRRKWLPTPIFLSGEFYGQRSLAR